MVYPSFFTIGNRIFDDYNSIWSHHMATTTSPQYWLFQTNPGVFRLQDALRAEAVETFAIKAHQPRIQPGDGVILWQTGKEAGVYALAKIVSEVGDFAFTEKEKTFFKKPPKAKDRVKIKVEYNLWNKPVTKELLPENSVFDEFYAGLPGTTFQATEAHYQTIVHLIEQLDIAAEPQPTYVPTKMFQPPLNLILYGPPGTGKTYQTVNHALSIIEKRPLSELALEDRQQLRQRFDDLVESGQIAFVTFHQAFSYEDFVEGIKPRTQEKQVVYAIEDGIFKRLVERAISNTEERFVLILDEINRGNIASIFGELITLLEPDKRQGQPEAFTTILPYSKTPLQVPVNLYLIGTMNTADRSVEALDVALRRRFTFREMLPQPELLARHPMVAGVNLEQLLTTLNQRIELLLDRNYRIGHAYFFDVGTLAELKELFGRKIIPLLQEYFFGDLGKIGLVLGKDFVIEIRQDANAAFAGFPHEYASEFAEKRLYRLRPMTELDEAAFIRIYEAGYI